MSLSDFSLEDIKKYIEENEAGIDEPQEKASACYAYNVKCKILNDF